MPLFSGNRTPHADPAHPPRSSFSLRYTPTGSAARPSSLYYLDLDFASRKQLWRTFFSRLTKATQLQTTIDDIHLDELASHDLNGRQIKNLISNGISIALHQKLLLSIDHIRTALNILFGWRKTVEEDFSGRTASALNFGNADQAQ